MHDQAWIIESVYKYTSLSPHSYTAYSPVQRGGGGKEWHCPPYQVLAPNLNSDINEITVAWDHSCHGNSYDIIKANINFSLPQAHRKTYRKKIGLHLLTTNTKISKHENSQPHVQAMAIWQERKIYIENNQCQ